MAPTSPVQLSIGSQIAKTEGFGALYKGLSAGLLRQATYTTARMVSEGVGLCCVMMGPP
jgi:hypothetical protein